MLERTICIDAKDKKYAVFTQISAVAWCFKGFIVADVQFLAAHNQDLIYCMHIHYTIFSFSQEVTSALW